jgi:amino acid adenylation domain-containing protein
MIEGYRLSPQQKQVWTLQMDGTAYLAHALVDIQGPLRADVLRSALAEIVGRHEALRTRFERPAGLTLPLQIVEADREIDWVDLPPAADEHVANEALARWMAHAETLDADRGFLRAALVRVTGRHHVLGLVLPVLSADGASLTHVLQEIGAIYGDRREELVDVDTLTQYSAYADWQNSLAEDQYGKSAAEFWVARGLTDVPTLTLPVEEPVAAAHGRFATSRLDVSLSIDTLERLDAVSKTIQADPETFLLACWHTLLRRLGSRGDATVGVLTTGRSFDELRSAVGPFARFVPLRCQYEGRPRFSDVLRQVDQQRFQAEPWTDYFDWDMVVAQGETRPHAPYFPYTFGYAELARTIQADEIRLVPRDCGARIDRFRLHLRCGVYGQRLLSEIEYDTACYTSSTVRTIARFHAALVKAFIQDPDRRIEEVPILTGDDRRALIATTTRFVSAPDADTLHGRFARVAGAHADRVAVVAGGHSLTYDTLDRRANRLAHELRRLGAAIDAPVGLCMTRSVDALVGLLAIVKAGAAYEPSDPDAPPAHIVQRLTGLRTSIVITESAVASRLEGFDGQIVTIDDELARIADQPATPPDVRVVPENLAYVIHTSGSTGTPRAVGVSHRSLVNYATAACDLIGCGPNASPLNFAVVSTLTADLGHTCVFPALLSGGRLDLIDYDTAIDSFALADYMTVQAIDVLKIVPSHLRELLDSPDAAGVIPDTCLVLGGESLTPDLADQITALHPSVRIIHHYGPTETTVGALVWTVGEPIAWPAPTVPLGRPLPNYGAYVCDENLNLLPPGVPGQLFIAGAGVARGYINDPARTGERFIPDGFSGVAGARMYATGDRARYLPDGSIEFLGRVDRQLKIRGHRVEPGEIEAVLRAHPAIRDAAVVVDDGDPVKKWLLAFVVPAGEAAATPTIDSALTGAIVREYLTRRVPEHMVPASITLLPSLPLTRNGKVDHARLRAQVPEQTTTPSPDVTEGASNPISEVVAELYAENLGVDRVSLHDDYFELGGHSLLAMRLASKIRLAFGVELPLRDIFDAPTPAKLSEAIQARLRTAAGEEAPPITRAPRDGDLPLSFGQQRLWFLDRLDANPLYKVLWSLRLRGPLDVDVLSHSLSEVVRRHEVLRTVFELRDEQPVQVIRPPDEVDVPVVDLTSTTDREAEARRLAQAEAQQTIDLARGPLLRARVLRLDHEDHVFLMLVHHIVSDRASREVLTRELMTIYSAYKEGRPHGLPELEIQYADYAAWQRSWLQGEALEQQLQYWRKQLEDAPVLEVPTDKPRPAFQTYAGSTEVLAVPETIGRALRQLGRREGATLYMVLLAVFQTLLHRYTGQEDIVVGSPIAGRNRAETEPLVGFFLNTLALRVSFAGRPTFVDVLHRVREAALGAYSHQDLPFEKLVEELNPRRDMSRAPLLQALFDMDMGAIARMGSQVGSLRVGQFAHMTSGARFDFELDALEGPSGVLVFKLSYRSDLFEVATIRRMLAHFNALLEGIVADPDRPITRIPLLTTTTTTDATPESERTVVRPSQPFTPFEREWLERSIADRFRAQAAAFPEHIAIRTRRHSWTYRELEGRAGAAAAALSSACTAEAPTVALLFDHDAPMIAGMIGTLMAGGCYVPLDPYHPDERLEDIVTDCQPVAILTSASYAARAASLVGDDAVVITLDDRAPSSSSAPPALAPVAANRLAYIIYTSGTEGRPKGVVQNHRNVLHHIRTYTNNLHIAAEDRLTLFSSYGSDAAVMDIFGALLNGATLYPIDPRSESVEELKAWLRTERLTIVHSTPTLFSCIVEAFDGVELPDARLVVLGGEEALQSHFSKYKECFSDHCLFVNGLGPTESTVTLQFFADKQTDVVRNTVPVGAPVEDTEILLLADDLDSAGVRGEICIRSPHMALGYWRSPAATQAAFVEDPRNPGQRIYRTGDLGRLLPDGNILYLGRADAQVKINGFRVEPGDVQAALNEHPNVLDSVVLCRAQAGERRLVAYQIPRERPAPDTGDLRLFMRSRLPAYMVPSAFVAVDRFPRLANGKLDRGALLAIRDASADHADAIAPRDLVELRLARLWEQLLDLRSAPVNADFFQLGGSSLAAIRLLARIEQTFGVRVPLAQLFQAPTIEGLASLIRPSGMRRDDSTLVPIQPHGDNLPLFCAHPVGGTVVCFAELARALGPQQPLYAFQHPALCGGKPGGSIEQLAATYMRELIAGQPTGPYLLAGLSMGGVIAYEMAQQLVASGREVTRLILFDAYAPRPRNDDGMDDAALLVAFVQGLGLSPDELRPLAPERRMECVLEVARERRIVTPDFTVAEGERLFAIAKGNHQAVRAYQPRPYAGAVTLFICEEGAKSRPRDRGWQGLLTGECAIEAVSGQHHTMLASPHVQTFAERLASCLRESTEADPLIPCAVHEFAS